MENWGLFASDFQWSSVPDMMHGAWMFDTSAILYTNILYALLMLIPLHYKETGGWQMTAKWVYMIVNGACIATNLADSVYFKYTMRRTTNTVFSEFSNEGNIGSIIGVEFLRHWYLVLLFIIIMWGMWKCYFGSGFKIKKRTTDMPRGKRLMKYYIVETLCFGIFIPLCICGMRGGATTAVRPITISNANQYVVHPQEAGIVLNTPFSLIRTIGKKVFEIPDYMSEKEMNALFSPEKRPNFSPSLNNSSSSLIPNS
ncbi:MAG: LTA synthase family protein, partial [Prevotellaceae bacterium]|nr:LTA synthase family protein [Prevotellaceae bacterium]